MLVLICRGKKYFVRDLSSDYHTEHGYLKKEALAKAESGDVLETNTGEKFSVIKPLFIDLYQKIKRGAQIISLKDLGVIAAECGINKETTVLEAGSGSGAATCYLAKIAGKVITYEIREDFFNIVKKNIAFLGLDNVEQKNKDIYEGIEEHNIDVLLLDLPEPWKVIPHAKTALRSGGFFVSYSPCIPQSIDFVNSLTEEFLHVKTVEVTEREWEIKEGKVRPKTRQIGHTGFISIARRL